MGAPPPSDPRPARPSLRGRGREILLGEPVAPPEPPARPPDPLPARPVPEPSPTSEAHRTHVDPASLPLTPEERAALLDFSPASPAYRLDAPLDATAPRSRPAPVWPPELPIEAPPPPDTVLLGGAPAPTPPSRPAAPPPAPDRDSLPLAERPAPEAARPGDPPHPARAGAAHLNRPTSEEGSARRVQDDAPEVQDAEPGARLQRRTASDEAVRARAEVPPPPEDQLVPPRSALIERPVRAVYDRAAAERDLVDLLVDDDKIRQLSAQIEALQEELVARAEGDPRASELYLSDLLQAGGLLRASRANYDDARAIVYRVRADLGRQRRVEADIRRYRPRLVAYYVLWAIVLVGLFLLKARVVELADRLGADSVGALYNPILFGAAGALISSLFALERHTAKLRDFDPVHTSSYLVNPLLGGAIGALMFALAALANEDLLRDDAQTAEYAITYLLCLVAGMNQHHILRRLGDVLKRFGRA